jgi:hypothetical protein
VQPGEVQPGEVQPGEVQPGEVQPGEVQPGEVQPGEVQPGEVHILQTQSDIDSTFPNNLSLSLRSIHGLLLTRNKTHAIRKGSIEIEIEKIQKH